MDIRHIKYETLHDRDHSLACPGHLRLFSRSRRERATGKIKADAREQGWRVGAGSSAEKRSHLQERTFPMDPAATSAVAGAPRALLRLEGLFVFALSVALYGRTAGNWGLFAALFLAPDLSFLAYVAGPRAGAIAYNAVHTTAGPLTLVMAGITTQSDLAIGIGLIWLAHCGIDRALGYGLKYDAGFGFTHLGRIGRRGTEAR
jgi:hypothetical protein